MINVMFTTFSSRNTTNKGIIINFYIELLNEYIKILLKIICTRVLLFPLSDCLLLNNFLLKGTLKISLLCTYID